MRRYILRRLMQLVPSLLLISFMVFALMHAVPGDPARAMVGAGEALDPQQLAAIRHEYNLDRPLPVQYVLWLKRALSGDLGRSSVNQRPVADELALRASVTFELGIFAWLICLAIAVPAGVLAAVFRGRWLDWLATLVAVGAIALPGFWFGIMTILLFGVKLGWLPTQGYVPLSEHPIDGLRHMLLPAVALGITSAALVMRQMRSALLEVLAQDYIRTAKAKGLAQGAIVIDHALRNAMLPVITVMGLEIGRIFAGAVVIETLFGIPGMGRLMVQAVFQRDFMIVQGGVLVMATAVLLVNFATDLLYGVLDPRIRYNARA
jgi:peptide/nickel transport system permease protein